jgi:uncharacterized protein (DUF2237 family)
MVPIIDHVRSEFQQDVELSTSRPRATWLPEIRVGDWFVVGKDILEDWCCCRERERGEGGMAPRHRAYMLEVNGLSCLMD